ncbi:MAG: LytTR family transcriptional regulator [Bacilli bacterium]|nr:LytTR family transcriptional regulator [Bacilli bacterium]
MKCFTFIDKNEEEKVIIYSKERTSLVEQIEKLVSSSGVSLTGTYEDTSILINPMDVSCFVVEGGKIYALINEKKYQLKERLYQLEDMSFNEYFVKLNQSCLANIKKIKEFIASIGGSVMVVFQNGYKDYISRRELKNVKERIGL